MTDQARTELFEHLCRVITWEMQAQIGVGRAPMDMPDLIADSLLDFFDVTLKPGVDTTGL